MRPPFLAETPLGAAPRLTREVFGNIPAWAEGIFYLVAGAAVGMWAYGIWRRVRLWRQGRPTGKPIPFRNVMRRLVRDGLLQRRMRGRAWASSAHVLLFSGFVVLFVGTVLIAIEHLLADLLGRAPNDPVFHQGVYFGVYELTLDLFGVAFLAGCAMLLARRLRGVGSFAKAPADVGILVLLIAIGITGYIVEGLRIILANTPLPGLSPVGYLCARFAMAAGVEAEAASSLHFGFWWFHAAIALAFIALMPFPK